MSICSFILKEWIVCFLSRRNKLGMSEAKSSLQIFKFNLENIVKSTVSRIFFSLQQLLCILSAKFNQKLAMPFRSPMEGVRWGSKTNNAMNQWYPTSKCDIDRAVLYFVPKICIWPRKIMYLIKLIYLKIK